MISSFRSMSLPLFALIAALAGCSGQAGSETGANVLGDISSTVTTTQASAPNGAQATAKGTHHKRSRHSHRGSASLVRTALRAPINLSAEQRTTIEGLLKPHTPNATSSTNSVKTRTFDAARAATLAAAVRSNSVESIPAAVKAVKPVDEAAREARIAAAASELKTLHDTLTPAQRVSLVESIQARAAAHAQRNAKQGERVTKGERVAKQGEARANANGKKGMLAGLDLSQAQKDALHAKLASMRPAKPSAEEREAMKARFTAKRAAMEAKLESFKGDSFDAKSFVTPVKQVAQAEKVGSHVNRRMQMLAALTSILEPAQREKLAARIEQGPARAKTAQVAN